MKDTNNKKKPLQEETKQHAKEAPKEISKNLDIIKHVDEKNPQSRVKSAVAKDNQEEEKPDTKQLEKHEEIVFN